MFIVVLFAFVFFSFVGNIILDNMNDDAQANDDLNNQSKQIIDEHTTAYPERFDGLFMLLFILLWCVVLVASWNINTHPIFFIFTIILMIFVFFIAAVVGNTFEELTADSGFSSIAVNYPMINFIMGNLLIVSIAVGFSIVIVLFARSRNE